MIVRPTVYLSNKNHLRVLSFQCCIARFFSPLSPFQIPAFTFCYVRNKSRIETQIIDTAALYVFTRKSFAWRRNMNNKSNEKRPQEEGMRWFSGVATSLFKPRHAAVFYRARKITSRFNENYRNNGLSLFPAGYSKRLRNGSRACGIRTADIAKLPLFTLATRQRDAFRMIIS